MWANIVNGVVVDLCECDPSELYHPDIAVQFTDVPEDAEVGMERQDDGSFAHPAVEEIDEPDFELAVVNKITRLQFMDRFAHDELTAIYNAAKADPSVEVFVDKLRIAEEIDLDNLQLKAGLEALVAANLLEADRVVELLSADQ